MAEALNKAYVLGGGLAGLSFAYELNKAGYQVTLFEKENYIGGLCHTDKVKGIMSEFGPHVLYWKTKEQKKWWEQFLANKLKEYYVRLSNDGTLTDTFDFPISKNNLKRLKDKGTYTTNEQSTNFEEYLISSVGEKAYNSFIKGYNIKQWGIEPSQMDAEWCKFRPLTIKEESPPKMFGNLEAGYPEFGYNSFFKALTKGIDVQRVSKIVDLDFKKNKVTKIKFTNRTIKVGEDDIVINTLPIDMFFNEKLEWRNIMKIYVVLAGNKVMPTYSTTFPNNYSFTRIVEYSQQSGQEIPDRTLISFAFPYSSKEESTKIHLKTWLADIDLFFKTNIPDVCFASDYIFRNKKNVYPLSTKSNLDMLDKMLKFFSSIDNLYTGGRMGLYAYISMANVVEMAIKTVNYIQRPDYNKIDFYNELRANLW